MAEEHRNDAASNCKTGRRKSIKITLIAAGTISLALGAIGAFLPTTLFLLLAAACYCCSSERMYRWLLNNKQFGEYIRNYREGEGIPFKTKIAALVMLWATIGLSTVFMLNRLLPKSLVRPMQLIMMAVATAVSVHILKLPTFKKSTTALSEKTSEYAKSA